MEPFLRKICNFDLLQALIKPKWASEIGGNILYGLKSINYSTCSMQNGMIFWCPSWTTFNMESFFNIHFFSMLCKILELRQMQLFNFIHFNLERHLKFFRVEAIEKCQFGEWGFMSWQLMGVATYFEDSKTAFASIQHF